LDSRDGEIVRTRSRENKEVNDIWLCDKGWFGYEFVSNYQRLQTPLIRKEGKLIPASWDEALDLITSEIQKAKPNNKIAGLGGNPLTTEENYLFQRLIREGAGVNHVDHRVGLPLFDLEQEGISAGMEISLGDCESLSFVVLLGTDLTEEFPLIWLRLKQAINRGAKVLFLGYFAPEISRHLTKTVLHQPGEELDTWNNNLLLIQEWMNQGKNGAIFVGQQYLNHPYRSTILETLWKFKRSHSNVSLNLLEGSGNSMGARLAGMRPDLAPLNERLKKPGLNVVQILEEAANHDWDILYVVGANPVKKYPRDLWTKARQNTKFLIVQDLFLNETAFEADVVLPALSFTEKEGTFVNIEQRTEKLYPGKEVYKNCFTDASIFLTLAKKIGVELSVDPLFLKSLAQSKIPLEREFKKASNSLKNIESQKLKAVFTPALFDQGVRLKHDPHLIQMSQKPCLRIHPIEAKKRGIQQGDYVELRTSKGKLQGRIKWDGNVAEQTIVIPLDFDEIMAHELDSHLFNGLSVDIQLIETDKEVSL
jgi:NADH-quinone oxidoreductase subunit G